MLIIDLPSPTLNEEARAKLQQNSRAQLKKQKKNNQPKQRVSLHVGGSELSHKLVATTSQLLVYQQLRTSQLVASTQLVASSYSFQLGSNQLASSSQLVCCLLKVMPFALIELPVGLWIVLVSGIGAVVKVVDSHLCEWGSIFGKSCSFLIVSLSKSLSLCFMCSDQHVKYRMPRGFPLTSSLLLDYHFKQYTHTRTHAHTHIIVRLYIPIHVLLCVVL